MLQQLNCRQHKVYGDGNCLYYPVAHHARYIKHSSHEDKFVGEQLKLLAIIIMQKYQSVQTEDGISQHQWEQKKLCILQPSEWDSDLKVCLLVIGIGREIFVTTGSGDSCTCIS